MLDDTGERLIPEGREGLIVHAEHLTRYVAAVEICRDKDVLDIASGSGYGSLMLAASAKSVVGVDISEEAVAHARELYVADNLEYRVGSGEQIPLADDSVDVVVTFETIEHIENYRAFVTEIRRVLRPGGIALVSTPNDLEYEEDNHYHLHEFERQELLDLLRPDFPFIEEYFQATWKYVAIDRLEGFQAASDRPTLNYAPITPEQARYFYFICSDEPIGVTIEPLGALGEHYSQKNEMRLLAQVAAANAELQAIRETRSFRLAQKISRIFRPFRRT
jgi:SAM-dependent methyltransferase